MTPKSVKPPIPRKAAREKESPDKEELSKGAPRPVREGPDNLRQRAQWFRSRASDKETK